MNVALLTLEFPPTIGGWSTFALNYALGLGRKGHDVMVVAPKAQINSNAIDRKFIDKNIRVFRLFDKPRMRVKHDTFNLLKKTALLTLVKRLLRNVEVIHIVTDYLGGVLGQFINMLYPTKPIVATIYGTYSIPKNVWEHLALERLFKISDAIVAISRYTANIVSMIFKENCKKITIIPGGVDVEMFNPEIDGHLIKEELSIPDHHRVLLSVGRLVPRKGFDLAMKAFKLILEKYPSTSYVIVGDGPLHPHLENLAKELGLSGKIIFAGKVDHHKLPLYYAACDVFLLTPKKIGAFYEGLGLVSLEAAACGKPVIVTKAGGISETVIHGLTGFVIPPNEIDIAIAVKELLGDDNLRRRMGEKAREMVMERYDWNIIMQQLEDLYRSLIGRV